MREAFLFALGIAASCVPEGMPAQVSVALSLAAGRLANKKAVVKKLSAVETLGSTHIICTDKTGTLTKNEMTVQKIMIGSETYEVSGVGYEANGKILNKDGQPMSEQELKKFQLFFENGVYASNAKVNPPDEEHGDWYALGDPTEAALIVLAEKAGIKTEEIDKAHLELHEFTFDSVRKRMSSLRQMKDKVGVYLKGSPQSVLQKCDKIWDGETVREMFDEDREKINAKDDEYALMALRNLGYAYKEIPQYNDSMKMEEVETGLTWLGLVAMIDPPREEVKAAMEAALLANIRVIIITGDYALTAEAIAQKIGLNAGKEQKDITVVNGEELQKLSDIDLLHKLIYSNLVFSRTAPEDKLRIVGLLKKAGEIVAVTGDGVNDAPALKKADIGVSMGKTGTDVAKNSSEIVLLDDSFATLVTAIREGRIIFQNLKKTIMSSLTSNGGELFAVLLSLPGSILMGYPISITAVQILAIDLVGEMLPLTFLTWDPAQPRIMTESPRNPEEHIMNKFSLIDLAWSGLLMGSVAYLNFMMLFYREGRSLHIATDDPFYMRATTLTYISIVMVQWANIMSRRAGGRENAFTSYLWSNKRLLLGYAISLFFLLNIVYNPYVADFMHTAPLTWLDWTFAVGGGLFYMIIREIHKFFRRRKLAAVTAL
jgi:Ca2+-transporting ATPase